MRTVFKDCTQPKSCRIQIDSRGDKYNEVWLETTEYNEDIALVMLTPKRARQLAKSLRQAARRAKR